MFNLNIKNISKILVETGAISLEEESFCKKLSKKQNKSIEQVLIEEKIISRKVIFESLKTKYGVSYIELNNISSKKSMLRVINYLTLIKTKSFPIKIVKNNLFVAMVEPLNIFHLNELKEATNFNIIPFFADSSLIYIKQKELLAEEEAIDNIEASLVRENSEYSMNTVYDFGNILEDRNLDICNDASDIAQLVNIILNEAIYKGASDIHFDPELDGINIRLRIDGEIQNNSTIPNSIYPNILSKIKNLSSMKISERRLPQDGKFDFNTGNEVIEIRSSTVPTVLGEKLVLRISNINKKNLTFDNLGFTSRDKEKILDLIKSKQGLILVTGPTGSGKTTTLYSILDLLNSENLNIITIEDPVEYKIKGINQIQVDRDIGLDFDKVLRHVLRQDPDIIMVGEIRDSETAKMVIRASITGHLVLSTLHTEDGASSILRLIDMGVEKYLVLSSIKAIISQRLVKLNCKDCLEYDQLFHSYKEYFESSDITDSYKSRGCKNCNESGYKSRGSIFEVLGFTDKVKEIFKEEDSLMDIRRRLIKNNHRMLKDDALEKLKKKDIGLEEFFKHFKVDDN